MKDRSVACQWRKCGKEPTIIYLGCGLCEKHWIKICEYPMEVAHKKLGIVLENNENNSKKDLTPDQ